MGMQLSEVVPLGNLDRSATQSVANALWEAAESNVLLDDMARTRGGGFYLDENAVSRVLQPFNPFETKDNIGQLMAAGWIHDIGGGRFVPTEIVGQIGIAPKEPRMSFDEACDQIRALRRRLDSAPREIDGIGVNHVFLFGSAIRNVNEKPTIGDLDLAIDFYFDPKFAGSTEQQRQEKAKTAWSAIISAAGDTRLGFRPIGPIVHEILTNNDLPDRPFGIVCLWSNLVLRAGSLSHEEQTAINTREVRTIQTQQRAQTIAAIAQENDTAPIRPGDFSISGNHTPSR
jgi:hypothetical protein